MADIITYNGSWLGYNGAVVTTRPDPNPLGLPAYTMRFQFDNTSYDPSSVNTFPVGSTWTQVSSSPNVWDFTYQTTDWSNAFGYANPDAPSLNLGQFKSETSGNTAVLGANTTNVSNMYRMFEDCDSLNSLALFDTSSVTNMERMFCKCTHITSTPLYDTGSVTNMKQSFLLCSRLASVPLFDMHSVTTTYEMFNQTRLTTVPLFDTSSVTDMTGMFNACSRLTTVPLFDTSSTTTMRNMFYNCTSLTSIPLFNTSSVTSFNFFLYSCAITSIPLFDTSSVTSMNNMCKNCRSLTSIPLFNTSSVTNMDYAFEECTAVESGALALYQQASSQTAVPYHIRTFRNCGAGTVTGSAELAQIPSGWK